MDACTGLDGIAFGVGARSFVFALPGQLYGLALPAGRSENECRLFEEVLANFSAYRDLEGKNGNQS